MKPEAEVLLPFAEEAIASLDYLTPDSATTIATLLTFCQVHHPRQVATKFRKIGEQLSREEKKYLGIRANAFMSHEALAQLTEKGRAAPLAAHETTLLRAGFSIFRARTIARMSDDKYTTLQYRSLGNDCAACGHLDGQTVPPGRLTPFPLKGCRTETCPLGYHIHTDFFGPLVDRYKAGTGGK